MTAFKYAETFLAHGGGILVLPVVMLAALIMGLG